MSSQWQTFERIVAFVEKVIAPGATVEHNKWLPIVGRQRKRQCDVVITSGEHPRQSIAIVEVQKRSRRPDLNTFHGWHRKMEQVGAQQLYCVSTKGFPASVIEEVRDVIGPTVKLLTMADIEPGADSPGIFLMAQQLHVERKFRIVEVGNPGVVGIPAGSERGFGFNTSERCFSTDGVAPVLTLDEIVASTLNASSATPPVGVQSIRTEVFIDETSPLWLHEADGAALQIRKWAIQVEQTFNYTSSVAPTSNFAYRQELHDGVLAWVARATAVVNGTTRDLCIVFKPDSEGYLRQVSVMFGEAPIAGQQVSQAEAH